MTQKTRADIETEITDLLTAASNVAVTDVEIRAVLNDTEVADNALGTITK